MIVGRCREGVAEDCCMVSILLVVPSCFNSFGTVSSLCAYFMIFTLVYIHVLISGVEKYTNMILGEEESVLISGVEKYTNMILGEEESVLISGVEKYTNMILGEEESVLISGVEKYTNMILGEEESVLISGVPL